MLKNLIILILISSVLSGFTSTVEAGTDVAAFLRIRPSARATAMGGAYVALADDGYAAYWNPAGVALTHRAIAITTLRSTSNNSDLANLFDNQIFVGGVIPILEKLSLGFTFSHFGITDIEIRNDQNQLQDTFNDSENATRIAVSSKLVNHEVIGALAVGLTFNRITQTLGSFAQGRGYALNLGIIHQWQDRFRWGFVFNNAIGRFKWTDNTKDQLTREFTVGMAYLNHDLYGQGFRFAIDLNLLKNRPATLHSGLELEMGNDDLGFMARLGYGRISLSNGGSSNLSTNDFIKGSFPTVGFGFRAIKRLQIDYSLEIASDKYALGNRQRLSISFNW
jgi:hypothetical protein